MHARLGRRPSVRARVARIAICCAGTLVGACAVQTTMPDLPRATPATWQTTSAHEAAGLQPDLDHWWHAFGDANLDRLIERALRENLTVKIAGERLRAARAVRHSTRGAFWPNLNFRIYEETAPGGQTGYLEMGFDSEWEFGFFGRAESTTRINLADLDNAAIDEAAARVSLIAEVARDYIELCAAHQRSHLLAEVAAAKRRQVTLAEVRLRTRLGSQADADRARGELQTALAEATEPAATGAQAEQSLAVLLGTDTPDVDSDAQPAGIPALPDIAIREAPADLLRTRPEIRRAEENVMHAAGELGIARADLYPKFSIVGTLISSTALTGDLDHPNKAVPLVGPALTIPIFDWGTRRDIVNAREAALSAAVLAYRESIIESVAEVRSALAQFGARTSLLDNATQTERISASARQRAQTLHRLGLADGIDLLNADLASAQARLARTSATRERDLSYIALYKSLGGAMPAALVEAGTNATDAGRR